MNTLTAIEAERVLQILKLASDRIHILSYLPDHVDSALLDEIPCAPVRAAVEKQLVAEETLRKTQEYLNAEIGGRDIALTKKIHKLSRATCRNLMADRDSLQVVMNRPESSREATIRFIKYLNELKSLTHQRLVTTVEDEAANRSQLHDLGERERQAEESRDALQAQLNEVRDEKEKVTYGLDQALRKLQFELHDLTNQNKVELEAVNREMSEAISKATTDHELRLKQLTDQVEGLERQFSEVMERNREEEQRLRKEKSRAENALTSRIKQYDEDMFSRQAIINELEASLKQETEEYSVLKEYFDKIDADLDRQKEENDILDAVGRRHAYAERVLHIAATYIQKIARARQAKALVESMKSKKGKKGGKKGKK